MLQHVPTCLPWIKRLAQRLITLSRCSRVLRRQRRVAQLDTAGLGCLQPGNGALEDHPAFLLGECGIDVQGERIHVLPSAVTMNGTFCAISDEMKATSRKAVELGNGHGSPHSPRRFQRRLELRALGQRIGAAAGLNLGESSATS